MRDAPSQKRLRLQIIRIVPFICMFAALFCGRFQVNIPDVFISLKLALINLLNLGISQFNQLAYFLQLPAEFSYINTSRLHLGITNQTYAVIALVRLPRVLAAAAVGAALSASGAAYQGIFRNPLVNPGLLGVSNGAGFGAALAIIVFGSGFMVYPIAFVFGLLAVVLSIWIARVYRQTPTIMLILGGVIVSSVFSALLSLMKYVADTDSQLPTIVFWLMGSLSSVGWEQFWACIPMALGLLILNGSAMNIDILSMGDKQARSLGVDAKRQKAIIVSGATLATAGAVCISGVVGWVGLIIPHIGRMVVGSANKDLMPASCCLGAGFMVIVDTCARCLWASEVPLGILTALIGAPFFVYLLKRTKGRVW